MMNSFRFLFYILTKFLALPWRLATYRPLPPAGPAQRRQGDLVEEDVELGVYLLR